MTEKENDDFGVRHLSDYKHDPERDRAIESAYRRGYMHGYSAGIDATSIHGEKAAVDFFNSKTFQSWRYKAPMELMVRPPVIGTDDKARE